MSKRFSKDMVYDNEGKRRFHGAFKGGFLRDDENPIAEGDFVPTSYISTRDNPYDFTSHSKEAYMDDEDRDNMYRHVNVDHRFSEQNQTQNFNMMPSSTSNININKLQRKKRYGIGYKPAVNPFEFTDTTTNHNRIQMSDILNGSSTNTMNNIGLNVIEDDDEFNAYANDTFESFKLRNTSNGMNQIEDISNNSHHRHHKHHKLNDLKMIENGDSDSTTDHHRRRKRHSKTSDGYIPIDGFVIAKCIPKDFFNYTIEKAPQNFKIGHIFKSSFVKFWQTKIINKSLFDNESNTTNTNTAIVDNTKNTKNSDKNNKNNKNNENENNEKQKISITDIKSKLKLNFKNKFVHSGTLESDGTMTTISSAPIVPKNEVNITLSRAVTTFRPAKLLCKRMNINDPYNGILPDYTINSSSLLKSSFLESTLNSFQQSKNSNGSSSHGVTTTTNTTTNTNTINDMYFTTPTNSTVIDPVEDFKQPDVDIFAEVFGS